MADLSEELKAIEKISTQLDGYKKELADKADKEQFKATEKALEELKAGLDTWSEKKIDESIEEINKTLKSTHEQIAEIREEQAQAKEDGKGSKKHQFVTLKEIEEFIEATFDGKQKTHNNASITIKAPEIFGFDQSFVSGTQIDAFTGREVDPVLYQRKRKRNLILDNFPITSISVPKLYYLEKIEVGTGTAPNNGAGGAAWILSGGEKPQRSFRLSTGEVEAKKVAIFGTIEDKLLRDVASMENWIREDFMDEIMEAYNDALLNNNPGTGDANAPLGLKTNAVQFAATPAFDELYAAGTSNYIDAIIAAAAAMATSKEQPSMAFVSDDVFYAIHNLKATDGKYLNNNLIYVTNLGELYIAGVHVIPADSEDVPSTHLLLVSADLGFKIRNYGSMVFERGLNADDFRHDRTSYRGYQEVLSYIPENRENSVLYDTFANIFAGIEAA